MVLCEPDLNRRVARPGDAVDGVRAVRFGHAGAAHESRVGHDENAAVGNCPATRPGIPRRGRRAHARSRSGGDRDARSGIERDRRPDVQRGGRHDVLNLDDGGGRNDVQPIGHPNGVRVLVALLATERACVGGQRRKEVLWIGERERERETGVAWRPRHEDRIPIVIAGVHRDRERRVIAQLEHRLHLGSRCGRIPVHQHVVGGARASDGRAEARSDAACARQPCHQSRARVLLPGHRRAIWIRNRLVHRRSAISELNRRESEPSPGVAPGRDVERSRDECSHTLRHLNRRSSRIECVRKDEERSVIAHHQRARHAAVVVQPEAARAAVAGSDSAHEATVHHHQDARVIGRTRLDRHQAVIDWPQAQRRDRQARAERGLAPGEDAGIGERRPRRACVEPPVGREVVARSTCAADQAIGSSRLGVPHSTAGIPIQRIDEVVVAASADDLPVAVQTTQAPVAIERRDDCDAAGVERASVLNAGRSVADESSCSGGAAHHEVPRVVDDDVPRRSCHSRRLEIGERGRRAEHRDGDRRAHRQYPSSALR